MRKSRPKTKVKVIVLFSFLAVSCLFLLTSFSILYFNTPLNLELLTKANNGIEISSSQNSNSTLYNSSHSICKLNSLPDYVLNAFIDTEDKHFYTHTGYDFPRIIKASLINMSRHSKSQGASTISQQLIKNAVLSHEKTYSRKIKELILSIKMERIFDKKQILEMYLNTIYFGANAYGIENASQVYFDKSAGELALNEACCLAGIIKSPSKYSPSLHIEQTRTRQIFVARNMLEQKHITQNEFEDVLSSPLIIKQNANIDYSYERQAIFEACQLLNTSERELIKNKYKIITNKDDNLQEIVKYITLNQVESIEKRPDFITSVCLNNGNVLAYCDSGNINFHSFKRQPASTLKPFAVYLPCLENDILSPATMLLDEPINYSGYTPQNANHKFCGYMSVRESVANSTNITAVKALDYLGIKKSKQYLENFDIFLTPSDANLSLALGNIIGGVKLKTMLNSYLVLANLGNSSPVSFVSKILNKEGKVIYSKEDFSMNISDKNSTFLMTDMLKDCAKYGSAKRLESLNLPIASKTGTAYDGNNNTDLYNFSFTTQHTIMSWLGSMDYSGLSESMSSSNQPTEVVKQICKNLYEKTPPSDFSKPDGIVRCAFDSAEKNTNHRIVCPTNNLRKNFEYDYFKISNTPIAIPDIKVKLNVELINRGANISWQKNDLSSNFYLKKIEQNNSYILKYIVKDDTYFYFDNYSLSNEKIEYQLIDDKGNILDSIVINPKEYLTKLVDDRIKSSKFKWFV